MMGLPPARTVADPPLVFADRCLEQGFSPRHLCGVTEMFGTTTGRPLTRTELTPLCATPPAELASPCRCTAGMLS